MISALKKTPLAWLLLAIFSASSAVADQHYHFDLKWERSDQESVTLFIETNIPDHAEVNVNVYRTYEATTEGKQDTYSEDHFRSTEILSRWKDPRRVPIDSETWRSDLMDHQAAMARLGTSMAFEIDELSDHVKVSAYVFGNKTGPRFDKRTFATQARDLVAKSELQIPFPLVTGAPIPKLSSRVGWDALKIGTSYRLLEETPLMRTLHGTGLDDIADMVRLPPSTIVRVDDIATIRGKPWYQVWAPSYGRMGWINSVALIRSGVDLSD